MYQNPDKRPTKNVRFRFARSASSPRLQSRHRRFAHRAIADRAQGPPIKYVRTEGGRGGVVVQKSADFADKQN